MKQKALIYCRVSSQRQVDEGSGLSSQEKRCRDYCKSHEYEVASVFRDEGVSGGLFERPAILELLLYLDKNPSEKYIVVFDDLKRFARDIEVHIRLRKELNARLAKIESPNFRFDDSAEGQYVEKILALTAGLEREQNRRQVIQKQKARLDQGYWCFCNPTGLKFSRTREDGKLLCADEPIASILKEAIERYANDYSTTKAELVRLIGTRYTEKGLDRSISMHGVDRILNEILYTGWLSYEPWGVSLRKAKHEGFISLDTYNKVQEKLKKKAGTKAYRNYNEDFPLRGLVYCANCGKPFTASWNTGRNSKYPNYFCKQKDCQSKWKTVSKEKIESEFLELLHDAVIPESYLKLAEAVLLDVWNQKQMLYQKETDRTQSEIDELDSKISGLVDRVANTSNDRMVELYEEQMQKLDEKRSKLIFQLGNAQTHYTQEQFGTALKKTVDILKSPLDIWKNDDLNSKRTLVQMYFDKPLLYRKESGFGTVEYRDEIKIFRGFATADCHMVEMGGVEPPC